MFRPPAFLLPLAAGLTLALPSAASAAPCTDVDAYPGTPAFEATATPLRRAPFDTAAFSFSVEQASSEMAARQYAENRATDVDIFPYVRVNGVAAFRIRP